MLCVGRLPFEGLARDVWICFWGLGVVQVGEVDGGTLWSVEALKGLEGGDDGGSK